jgi:ABC-2 type transport system permease protein
MLLPMVAFLAGEVFFGNAPLRSPIGDTIGGAAMLGHLLIAVAYIGISLLFVAALAFLLSVITDAPLGAVGGAVMLVIVSNILDAVTALGSFRQVLPTHYSFSWLDVIGAEITWDSMFRGALWSIGYSAVFFALAWWHFERKDITS